MFGPVTPIPTTRPVVLATVTEFEFAAVEPPVSAVVLVEDGSIVRLLLMVLLPLKRIPPPTRELTFETAKVPPETSAVVRKA